MIGWFEHFLIPKKFCLIKFLGDTLGTLGTAQTLRWPCEPIILSIGHFESPTEV